MLTSICQYLHTLCQWLLPGRNVGKVAKLVIAVQVPFDDRFLLSGGERERASLETTVGTLWRRTSPTWYGFNSRKGATLTEFHFLLLQEIVGDSRMTDGGP